MNSFLMLAFIFALLSALLCYEFTREFLLRWTPVYLKDWAESWMPFTVSLLVAVLLGVGVMQLPKCRECDQSSGQHGDSTGKRENSGKASDDNNAQAVAARPKGGVLAFRVVRRVGGDAMAPLPGATVRVGQDESVSDENGRVQVLLSAPSLPDTLVRISDKLYMSRFLRFDDSIIANRRDVELSLNLRVLVIDPQQGGAVAVDERSQAKVRKNLESALANSDAEVLADDKLRDEVVYKLHQFSEGRALYDPKTLQRIGDFHGATHGVFWSLDRDLGLFNLECKLVNFKTSQVEKTANVHFTDEKGLDEASSLLAENLLFQLTRTQILSPKNESLCGRKISLEGYALYRAPNWTLWITIQPEGNAMHFPQFRITVEDDGSWFASDVYLGDADQKPLPMRFYVYAVLTGREYTKRVDEYLDVGTNRGLNLNSWDRQGYRILDRIRITRVQGASAGCTVPGN